MTQRPIRYVTSISTTKEEIRGYTETSHFLLSFNAVRDTQGEQRYNIGQLSRSDQNKFLEEFMYYNNISIVATVEIPSAPAQNITKENTMEPNNIRHVVAISEDQQTIDFRYNASKDYETTRVSFDTLRRLENNTYFNIDSLSSTDQQIFVRYFFHANKLIIVTDKPSADPTTVTIPDETLHGTVPTSEEIATAVVKSANEKQIDGDHYKKHTIQPWDYIIANNLDFMQGNIVRYITRYKDKHADPLIDLKKAQHFIEKMIEVETEKQQQRNNTDNNNNESDCAKHYTQYSPEYEDCINKINKA